MVFKYKKISKHEHCSKPYLKISLSNLKNNRGYDIESLLDSGADNCLINSRYSELLLNEDYTTGKMIMSRGVEGQDGGVPVYFHDLGVEIKGLTNQKLIIPFGFINSPTVNVLLGREIFFDTFKITFVQKNNYFDIELMP